MYLRNKCVRALRPPSLRQMHQSSAFQSISLILDYGILNVRDF